MSIDGHNHDENCNHDHDEEEGEFDGEGEIEVNIDPKDDRLEALGIEREEFEEALLDALDSYNDEIDAETGDAAKPLEEVTLTIRGTTHRLGDLADVTIDNPDLEIEDDEESDD